MKYDCKNQETEANCGQEDDNNLVYVIKLLKQPMPETVFKEKLKQGCDLLNIPLEFRSMKDSCVDECVDVLMKTFNDYEADLNKILKK